MCTGMHCTECGYNCHEKCVPHVPKNCTKVRPASHLTSILTGRTVAAPAGVQSVAAAESGTGSTLVASPTQAAASAARGTNNFYYVNPARDKQHNTLRSLCWTFFCLILACKEKLLKVVFFS